MGDMPSVEIKGGIDIKGGVDISKDVKLPSGGIDLDIKTSGKKFAFMAESGSSEEDISGAGISVKPPSMGGKMDVSDGKKAKGRIDVSADIKLPSADKTKPMKPVAGEIKGGIGVDTNKGGKKFGFM